MSLPTFNSTSEFLKSIEKFDASAAILAQDSKPLSYGQLCRHIARVVTLMNNYGLGRNDRVAVVLPNGPEMAVTFLSVIAGFTCVPLNPFYRAQEYDFCLSEINPRALIVQTGQDSPVRSVARSRNIPIMELIPLREGEAGLFDLEFSGMVTGRAVKKGVAEPEDTALIMQTSGTTSRPKIIHWSQRKLFSSTYTVCHSFELKASDRCLNVMPLFHMHGLLSCLLASLYGGGSVVCTPGFDHNQFFNLIEKYHPTWYSGVSVIHHSVLELAEKYPIKAEHAGLRFIRHSSSPLSPTVMNKLEGLFKAPVIEVYGMTEITPITINPLDSSKRKPASAGLAVGLDVSIMDEKDNILPKGETGEIVIRGEHVIKRYENNDAANGKAFSRGWFRTGDLGYIDDEGYLFISGRLKEIINVGGQKISPSEIEEILIEHPLVREAAAFGVPHKSLGEAVAAAVVVHREGEVSEMEMQRFLADRLAPYKVPQQIIIVDSIPKGPMGKLLRRALAEEFSHLLKQKYRPPSTETEIVVAEIWQEVLGTERVGILDNLFALGGDSIHATRIVSRINNVFNLQLPLQRVFEAPTVAGLSDMVDTARWLMTEIQPRSDGAAYNLEEGRI